MSHWEGFRTLLMVTDTSNALRDPVLYGAYTVCKSKGGYCGVIKTSSKKNPCQAVVTNKRRGKQQGIGSYSSAKIAAIRVSIAIKQNENDDMESPRKHKKRGECSPSPVTTCHHL